MIVALYEKQCDSRNPRVNSQMSSAAGKEKAAPGLLGEKAYQFIAGIKLRDCEHCPYAQKFAVTRLSVVGHGRSYFPPAFLLLG